MLAEEIHEAINKSLPLEVGTALKARLETAESDSKKVVEHGNKIVELRNQLSVLNDKVRDQSALISKEHELDERHVKIVLREALIELREAHAKQRYDDAGKVLTTIFANRVMRETTYKQVPIGGDGYTKIEQETTEVTRTEESDPDAQ